MSERAILAGGCFWGMEELIRAQAGVLDTEVGYTGGTVANATYAKHDGHAEAIAVTFDPSKTSYRQLLEFFFQIHNPTTKNRQGNDVGSSYRSAIFYLDNAQKQTAEEVIAKLTNAKIYPAHIVTEVVPAKEFWSAEKEHQDYLQKNPYGYTCHYIRPEWSMAAKQ